MLRYTVLITTALFCLASLNIVTAQSLKEPVIQNAAAKTDTSQSVSVPSTNHRIAPIEAKKIDQVRKELAAVILDHAEDFSPYLARILKRKVIFGITWLEIVLAVVTMAMVLVFERTINQIIRRRIIRPSEQERDPNWFEIFLGALAKPLVLFIWVYGVYATLTPLFSHFDQYFGPDVVRRIAAKIAEIGGAVAFIWFMYRLIRLIDFQMEKRAVSPESRIDHLQAALVGKTLRWGIVILGAVLVFQYVTGVQAGPLIASLGLGGLAVALAAKESIANLFGTATVAFDNPFTVGERIKIEGFDGFVESVGYRSTNLRLWNGNLASIPNQKIITASVENFARRPHIQWRTDITITYDTQPDKVDRAVDLIKEIFDKDEDTSTDWPPWIFFSGFNDWSLNLFVNTWYKPKTGPIEQRGYYAWRNRISRAILRAFAQEGIQFAFPTRTTYLANDDTRQLKLKMLMGEQERA